MEIIRKNSKFGFVPFLAAFIITAIVPGFKSQVLAGSGAAFLGGMLAGHVVGGFVRRDRMKTAAAVETASQPRTQTVYVKQPTAKSTPATKPTVEQRLKELDKLAKDGYITPEEYKARKKAIVDSL